MDPQNLIFGGGALDVVAMVGCGAAAGAAAFLSGFQPNLTGGFCTPVDGAALMTQQLDADAQLQAPTTDDLTIDLSDLDKTNISGEGDRGPYGYIRIVKKQFVEYLMKNKNSLKKIATAVVGTPILGLAILSLCSSGAGHLNVSGPNLNSEDLDVKAEYRLIERPSFDVRQRPSFDVRPRPLFDTRGRNMEHVPKKFTHGIDHTEWRPCERFDALPVLDSSHDLQTARNLFRQIFGSCTDDLANKTSNPFKDRRVQIHDVANWVEDVEVSALFTYIGSMPRVDSPQSFAALKFEHRRRTLSRKTHRSSFIDQHYPKFQDGDMRDLRCTSEDGLENTYIGFLPVQNERSNLYWIITGKKMSLIMLETFITEPKFKSPTDKVPASKQVPKKKKPTGVSVSKYRVHGYPGNSAVTYHQIPNTRAPPKNKVVRKTQPEKVEIHGRTISAHRTTTRTGKVVYVPDRKQKSFFESMQDGLLKFGSHIWQSRALPARNTKLGEILQTGQLASRNSGNPEGGNSTINFPKIVHDAL